MGWHHLPEGYRIEGVAATGERQQAQRQSIPPSPLIGQWVTSRNMTRQESASCLVVGKLLSDRSVRSRCTPRRRVAIVIALPLILDLLALPADLYRSCLDIGKPGI